MVPIHKEPLDIPEVLINNATKDKLKELLEAKKFITENRYKELYGKSSIKDKLKQIYNKKCCYCESKYANTIEHYRPKVKYYWLVYSWDNLLLACETCNSSRGNDFKINGEEVEYDENFSIEKMHNLSTYYDSIEKPLLLNPESIKKEELETLSFKDNGEIDTSCASERLLYTIHKCDLNRKSLCDERKKIIDKFKNSKNSIELKMGRKNLIDLKLDYEKLIKNNKVEYIAVILQLLKRI